MKDAILFIEDDISIAEVFEDISKIIFPEYKILIAENGISGLKLYNQHKNSIKTIFIDKSMPKLDGEGLIKIIREHDKDTPIVLTTGALYLDGYLLECEKSGSIFVLPKPYDFNKLKQYVNDLN